MYDYVNVISIWLYHLCTDLIARSSDEGGKVIQ